MPENDPALPPAEALEPCPWCGTTDKLEVMRPMQPAAGRCHVVWCHRCEFRGPSGEGHSGARAAWNRRAPHPDTARLDLIERHGLTVKKQGEDWLASDPAYDCLVSEFTARAAIDAAKEALEGEAKP